MNKYRWIITQPVAKTRPSGRPDRPAPPNPCDRCGYDPVPPRAKKCPACLAKVAA